MVTRRRFLKTLAATAAAGVVSPWAVAASAAEKKKLNVLFIMADDLNTALSGYGHPQCKTPNLDRLAARGVSFTRAYTQFPLCGPSRASLMTGKYPLANGVQSNGGSVSEDTVTLPRLFRQHGYWTGRVSKMYHMGVPGNIFTGDNGEDHAASWDERFNVSAMETLTPGKAEDLMLEDSTHLYPELREKWAAQRNKGGKFMIPEGNRQGSDFVVVEAEGGDDVLADGMAANKAVELLETLAGKQQPFFLGVGFVRPHVPLVASKESFEGYATADMQPAPVPEGDLDDIPDIAKENTNERKYKMGVEAQQKVLRGYYASITYMDAQVGRLLDALDRLAMADNTIVVFASDHGYHLGEHTMWQKQSLMEESIRVPLIVSVPGQQRTGTQCDRLVELLDVYPTLADVAGLEPPDDIQGLSFAALLDNPDAAHDKKNTLTQVRDGFCLRNDKWAYMRYNARRNREPETMLYNMEADPKQFTNLSGNPAYAAVEKQLHEQLQARVLAAAGK